MTSSEKSLPSLSATPRVRRWSLSPLRPQLVRGGDACHFRLYRTESKYLQDNKNGFDITFTQPRGNLKIDFRKELRFPQSFQ